MPITSYTCTQPNQPGFLDQGQCTVSSSGLRTCAIKGGAHPALLSSNVGVYEWHGNTNHFVVLDIRTRQIVEQSHSSEKTDRNVDVSTAKVFVSYNL